MIVQCAVRQYLSRQEILRRKAARKVYRLQCIIKIQSIARMYQSKVLVHRVRQLLVDSNRAFVEHAVEQSESDGLQLYDRVLCNAVNTVDATQEDPLFSTGILTQKAINSDKITYSVLFDHGEVEEILPASIERIVFHKGDAVYALNTTTGKFDYGKFSHFEHCKERELKKDLEDYWPRVVCVVHFEQKNIHNNTQSTKIVFDTPIHCLQSAFQIDDLVETRSPHNIWQGYFRGKVIDVNAANNTYTIYYNDDEIERDVPSYLITKILSIGLTVYATAPDFDYHYYRGRIKQVNQNGTYTIHFDDGDVHNEIVREDIREVFDEFENNW